MLDILLSLAVVASTCFTALLLCLPSRYRWHSSSNSSGTNDGSNHEPKISVQVLVLGDIGRSPRMQYHAISIAKHGGRVDVIGYKDSALHPGLINNPLISIVALAPPPFLLQSFPFNGLPFLVTGPLKVVWQIWTLFQVLGYRTRPARWLLVQNPPSIPTLAIAFVICFLRNTHLLIDWHNYGWSILAGTKGASHPFVSISKVYEAILGRYAPTASFTVTNAMARQLRSPPYSIQSPVLTLHDRPAEIFQPIKDSAIRQKFLNTLTETAPHAADIMAKKAFLIVSSTSWTPDEDFGLLLDALVSYSTAMSSNDRLPPIISIITGKGPQKQLYLDRIARLNDEKKLSGVTIMTVWLSMKDYASLLACADLGVCLHMSSSGVDLPMKVVDMFGAGLPVAGYSGYESWPELVTEGETGRGFTSSEGLKIIFEDLLEDSRRKEKKSTLDSMKEYVLLNGKKRWDEEWDNVAGRLLCLCD